MEKGYYVLETENNKVEVTGNHLIYSKEGYVRVDSLLKGDYVFIEDGWMKIKSLVYYEKDLDVVYNLELASPNNYYAEGILVHNLKEKLDDDGDPGGEEQPDA